MAQLYLRACIGFDFGLYSWLLFSYYDAPNYILLIFGIVLFVSLYLLLIPNGYHNRGLKISRKYVDMNGYLLMTQILLFFVAIPYYREDNLFIIMIVAILFIISLIKWIPQKKTYKEIREHVSLQKLIHIAYNPSKSDILVDKLRKHAWKTFYPFLLWGVMENDSLIMNLFVFSLMLIVISYFIYKLYQTLMEHFPDNLMVKRDFKRTLVKVIGALSVLLIMCIILPKSFFNFVVIAYISTQFIDLVHRQVFDQDITSLRNS